MESLSPLLNLLLTLGGVMSLLTVLVNVGKVVGVVKDGTASTWARGLNLLAVGALFILGTWYPDVDIQQVDALAAQVAELGVGILAILPVMMKLSGSVHNAVRGLKIIGHSNDA